MIGELITWLFLAGGLVFAAGIAFFMWLNFRSSTIDDKSYDSDFKPGEMVAKYRYEREDPEDSYDAAHALRKYAHTGDGEESLHYDARERGSAGDEDRVLDDGDSLDDENQTSGSYQNPDTSLMPSANESHVIEVPHPKQRSRDKESDIVDADVIPEKPALPDAKPKIEKS